MLNAIGLPSPAEQYLCDSGCQSSTSCTGIENFTYRSLYTGRPGKVGSPIRRIRSIIADCVCVGWARTMVLGYILDIGLRSLKMQENAITEVAASAPVIGTGAYPHMQKAAGG